MPITIFIEYLSDFNFNYLDQSLKNNVEELKKVLINTQEKPFMHRWMCLR